MSKEELLQFEGLVLEILPDARYRVQLDNGHELIAYTAGKMKKNRIKTLAGDRVTSRFHRTIWKRGGWCFATRTSAPVLSAVRRSVHNSVAADFCWSRSPVLGSVAPTPQSERKIVLPHQLVRGRSRAYAGFASNPLSTSSR